MIVWNGNSIWCKAEKLKLWMARSLRFTPWRWGSLTSPVVCSSAHQVWMARPRTSQDLHLPWRTALLLPIRCTEQIVLASLRLCQYFSTHELSWWGICQHRNTSYYDCVNDHSSLVWRKRSIPGFPWSSQERRLSEAQSLDNSTDLRAGFLYWFPHSRVRDMQTGIPGCYSCWATQNNTDLVGPTCTFLYIVLCLASSAKCWTKEKRLKTPCWGWWGSGKVLIWSWHLPTSTMATTENNLFLWRNKLLAH